MHRQNALQSSPTEFSKGTFRVLILNINMIKKLTGSLLFMSKTDRAEMEGCSLKNHFGIKTTMFLAMFGLASCAPVEQATQDTKAAASSAEALSLEKFQAYTGKFPQTALLTQNHATGHIGDFFFTHWKDGGAASLAMDADGAFSVSWQGGGYNYVGGPGWHYGDKDRVIGYRFDEDSGASYITLYGWGYDKTMPASDPAHLVEYYILQRWTYDPSQNATFGKTFISNGVEYSTYRSIREQKPSINNTATFYQYWSKPTEQRALGENHEIVFADHVKAWADSGWILPDMNNLNASDDPTYQVMAVEVFNPGKDGTASGKVWDATPR